MRDSNYRSIIANRAAVTISTTLYDRRALDCTSDKPLVNSLNHLTFLASSSGKVRETLSNDGGLERLVDILYHCKVDENSNNAEENPLVAWKWSLAFQCLVLVGTRGTEAIRKKVVDAGMIPVIATVLDNYLAMNGDNASVSSINSSSISRGSGFGRQFAFNSDRYNGDDSVGVSTNSASELRAPRTAGTFPEEEEEERESFQPDEEEHNDNIITNSNDIGSSTNNNTTTTTGSGSSGSNSQRTGSAGMVAEDIIDSINQGKKKITKPFNQLPDQISQLREKLELLHNIDTFTSDNSSQEDYLALQKLVEYIDDGNFTLDCMKRKYAKFKKNRRQLVDLTAPRNFINGILVPREDDVLWSLQLLAFISKYSYLKPILSETNIITGMSLRSPPQDDLLSFKGTFSNSVPALENDDNDNDNDNELEEVISVDNEKKDDGDEIMIDDATNDNNNSGSTREVDNSAASTGSVLDNKFDFMLPLEVNSLNLTNERLDSPVGNSTVACAEPGNFAKLSVCLSELETMDDKLSKAKKYVKLNKVLNRDLKQESLKFKALKINHRKAQSNNLKSKWNYKTYPYFDNLNEDQDQFIKPLEILNIFPLVEKFTVKSSHSKEIHYWAGVIMRNSCRRDESKGGVRQCACFDCGRWEEFPRQFAKCRRCKRTKYCSKECQSNAWEYHRHWCVQTTSSSSTAPSTSAAAATVASTSATNPANLMIDLNNGQFGNFTAGGGQNAVAAVMPEDVESTTSSINTTTTAAMLRHQQQQQPLVSTPLGAFTSPAHTNVNPDLSGTRANTPFSQRFSTTNNAGEAANTFANFASGFTSDNTNNNNNNNTESATPVLAPTNYRGVNFGTIAFHNAVHATLAATNNTRNPTGEVNSLNGQVETGAAPGTGNGNNRGFLFGSFSSGPSSQNNATDDNDMDTDHSTGNI